MKKLTDFGRVTVKDKGNLLRERIIFRIRNPINLLNFVLLPVRYDSSDDTIMDLNRQAFWFPEIEVVPNDSIILYSGQGNNRVFDNRRGTQTYVFYWDLESTVWDQKEAEAISILRIDGFHYQPLTEE